MSFGFLESVAEVRREQITLHELMMPAVGPDHIRFVRIRSAVIAVPLRGCGSHRHSVNKIATFFPIASPLFGHATKKLPVRSAVNRKLTVTAP
jgi:hypothetical protein